MSTLKLRNASAWAVGWLQIFSLCQFPVHFLVGVFGIHQELIKSLNLVYFRDVFILVLS